MRIGDVIKEVKRQIGSLQRQAGKARRYQALHGDLRVLETHHSRKQLDSLEAELGRCQAEIARLSKSEETSRAKIDTGESQLAEQRRVLDELDGKIAEVRSELQRLQGEIGTHQNQIQFNRQRAEELTALIERSKKDIAATEAKRAQQGKEIEDANALIEKTGQLLRSKEAELAKITDLLSELHAARSAHESKLEMLRVAISKTEKRIAELQEEISGLAIRRETTEENRRGIEIAISDARGARDKAQNEIAAARAAGEAGRKNLELLKATLQASQENLRQHRLLFTDAEKGLAEIERALVEKESRFEILRQLNEEGEGLGQGSQAVLKGLDDPARIHAALGGALVSNLDVDSEYVAAIEAALGRNLQAIVLKDAGLAPAILAKLNEKKFGQAALALPSLSNYSPKTQTALPRKALAWANDKVKAPESLAPLVTRLLGNVAVFGDLEEALSFKKDKHNLAAATLTGEFISAEGVVFGGSRETSTDSLLQRKAQMAGLKTECADVRRQRDALLQKRDEANAALEKATSELEEARRQYESADRERSAFDNRIPFLEQELQENEQKIDQLRLEQMTLAQQIQAADARISKHSKRTKWKFKLHREKRQRVKRRRRNSLMNCALPSPPSDSVTKALLHNASRCRPAKRSWPK